MKITGLILVCLLGLVGCSSVNTIKEPRANLRSYQHIYVLSTQNDSSHLDQLIANELQRLGYDATAGVRTMMPDNAQLTIAYEAQWNWDFRTYLIQLEMTVREVRTEKYMARGQIFHPGVTKKTPEKMVKEVLGSLFEPK